MANEEEKALLADLMASVRAGIAEIERAQRKQATLTATASAAGKRVTVVVNANGVVIETRFGNGVEDLTYAELARACTSAAQDAAAQMRRKTEELVEGLRRDQSRLPRLSEFIPGMPDVQDMLPTPPEVSTAPPRGRAAAAGTEAVAEEADGAMKFTDVVPWNHGDGPAAKSGVAESGW
ncbi:YbaB/EbfC family nucleoid-associated protein [Nocardia bovistercoris]|uniref:YbaB/EbfC family nucleoid-associated protein n=1 Tax=Nocardia bovistercoris TaxID=2785916 RepID=A0A931IBR8_9NOCA|nr:YbaB/EbfC family nucleoid-associated protein [Nocardia bovistercoris]MBH0777598.1 YbaB/EbfC family nucleoid-associated protein [Nocardia bovistercoris]